MKQYIIEKQLNELSKKGLEKYKKHCHEKNIHKYSLNEVMIGDELLPLLSIGQMIAFLDEKKPDPSYLLDGVTLENICDELWEEAREVFEK